MAKASPTKPMPGQLPLFGFIEYVPVGDDTFRAVARAPIRMASITHAARIAGKSRAHIYRLFKTSFITGDHSSPGKIQIDVASLQQHIAESREPDYWTRERKNRYRGK